MPRFPTLAAIVLAAAIPPLSGQTTDSVSFSGTTVNTVTGAPVRYAQVILLPTGGETQTDAAGAFRFPKVDPGEYLVVASKAGFISVEGREHGHEVSLKTSRDKYQLGLTPLSTIRGRITDGLGEPVEGVTVLAMQSRIEAGHRRNQVLSTVQTNDRGEYRIPLLPAGEYLVKASGQLSQTSYYGRNAPPLATQESFVPVYFGGSRDASGAVPVALQPGAEARADFSVAMQPGHTIRGRITNLRPHCTADLRLFSGDEDLGVNRSSLELVTGQFEIDGVLDGAYRLQVYQQSDEGTLLFAEQTIVLTGHDVERIALAVAPAPSLKGKVRVEGQWAQPAVPFAAILDAQDSFLALRSGMAQRASGAVADGRFEVPSVFPGKYWTRFRAGDGLYVSSAYAGDRDLLATQEFVAAPVLARELDIVLRTDGGKLMGTFATEAVGGPAVVVLLVPDSCNRPASVAYAGPGNGFSFSDLAPGTYRLHVLRETAQVEFGSPAALCRLARGGTQVAVKAGEVTTVELQKPSEEPK
jgi:Carboxypeptidase regulatory-like domain